MVDMNDIPPEIAEAYQKNVLEPTRQRMQEARFVYPLDVTMEALRELHTVLKQRHYGRMPDEVQAAYDKAGDVLDRYGRIRGSDAEEKE